MKAGTVVLPYPMAEPRDRLFVTRQPVLCSTLPISERRPDAPAHPSGGAGDI